jgi:hypothetical protein
MKQLQGLHLKKAVSKTWLILEDLAHGLKWRVAVSPLASSPNFSRIGQSRASDRDLEALATHWTAASTLRGRRDAGKLIGGHSPSIGSAKQVNAKDTTDVSKHKIKTSFFSWGLHLKMAKKKIALLRTLQTPQRPRFSLRGRRPQNLINIWKRNCPSSPELSEALNCQNQIRGIAFAKPSTQNSRLGETAKGSGVQD